MRKCVVGEVKRRKHRTVQNDVVSPTGTGGGAPGQVTGVGSARGLAFPVLLVLKTDILLPREADDFLGPHAGGNMQSSPPPAQN